MSEQTENPSGGPGVQDPHAACGVKMYWSVAVGSKGQVVIPKDVRDELGINPGDSLIVLTKHGKAIGMIKADDMREFMDYMQREMSSALDT